MTKGSPGSSPTCSVDGCGAKARTRGWCYAHYVRWRKYGDPTILKRPKTWGDTPCSVAQCLDQVYVKGLCSKHFQRQKAHGDPLKLLRRERGTGSITVNGYHIVTDHGHPLENARGVLVHRSVLHDVIGPGEHPCHWCGRAVSWDLTFPESPAGLVVDHLDNDGLNNEPSNLVPSCGQCNIQRTS